MDRQMDVEKRLGDAKKGEATSNEQLRRPLSVTSGIALCAEKPSGKGLITIVMRIASYTNEYLYTRVYMCVRARVHMYVCVCDVCVYRRVKRCATFGHACV